MEKEAKGGNQKQATGTFKLAMDEEEDEYADDDFDQEYESMVRKQEQIK